jgi:hypothetical protein
MSTTAACDDTAGGTAVNDAVVQALGYEPSTIMVTRFGLKRDVGRFPDSKRMTKLLEGAFDRFYGR